MRDLALVFVGAGAGGALRHLTNLACLRWFGPAFPVGTLAVNVAGSFAMGLAAAWLAARAGASWSEGVRLVLMTGVLGGYTTFSAFSLDALGLWQRGMALEAVGYVAASVGASIAALVGGVMLVRTLS